MTRADWKEWCPRKPELVQKRIGGKLKATNTYNYSEEFFCEGNKKNGAMMEKKIRVRRESFFFFLTHPWHAEVPGPAIKPEPQQ